MSSCHYCRLCREVVIHCEHDKDEKRAMAQDLATKNIGLQGLEEERKAVVSNYKARIDQTNAEIGVLANYLAQGKKQQMYKCYLDFDRTRKMRLWKEQKTHRVIKEEPMKEEDAQIKFGQGTR